MIAPLLTAGLLILAQFGETPNEYIDKAGRAGVGVSRSGGNIRVTDVTAGSSAEKAGIKVGDEILRIDVDSAENMSASTATAELRGAFLSTVTLIVLPRGSMLPRTVDVKRDVRVYDAAHSQLADKAVPGATPDDGRAPDVISVSLTDFQRISGNGSEEKLHDALARSGSDVETCIGALGPEIVPRELTRLGATFTFGSASGLGDDKVKVRTDPPSGDLSSCLGKRSTNWKVPKPGRKDPDTVVQVFWEITRTR